MLEYFLVVKLKGCKVGTSIDRDQFSAPLVDTNQILKVAFAIKLLFLSS